MRLLDSIFQDEKKCDEEYQMKQVTLNKPFRNNEGNSKFSVYVENDKGNIVKVNFGAVSELLDSNMKLTTDTFTDYTKHIDEDTGFMHIDAVIARSGIQEYLGIELDDEAEPMKMYNVYRPSEEVLHEDSLNSYVNATVTDNHPSDFVTTDNIKELHKGSSAHYDTFNKDGIDYVKTKLVITDSDLIKKVQEGKVEISAGYSQNLVKESGVFDGLAYDYKQTNIRVNHIAIVDKGRCGSACKLSIDESAIILNETKLKQGSSMAKLKIGDAEVEVCDTVIRHIDSLKSTIKSKDEEMKEDADKMEILQAAKDLIEAELKKLQEAQPEMEDAEEEEEEEKKMAEAVDAKVALITSLRDAKIEVKSTDSILDMKKAFISANSKVSLDGKSSSYIEASFDALMDMKKVSDEKQTKVSDSQRNAFKDMSTKTMSTDAEISQSIFAKKQAMFKPVGGNK